MALAVSSADRYGQISICRRSIILLPLKIKEDSRLGAIQKIIQIQTAVLGECLCLAYEV